MSGRPAITFLNDKEYWLTSALFGIVWWFSKDDYFFWDTIQLSSKQAHFFYESKSWDLILPSAIDSGHFPLMGIYLSSWWSWFGKTILVSHLSMIPWILLIILNIVYLSKEFFDVQYRIFAVFILCLDPTLLAQLGLVSPDVLLMASFLTCLSLYRRQNVTGMSISWLILSLVSMRGAMVAVALALALCWHEQSTLKNFRWKMWIRVLLPAFLANILFFSYHFYRQQWIGFHDTSPWAQSFDGVTFYGWVKNLGLVLWRFLDFGRIGLWILLLIFWYTAPKAIRKPDIAFWLRIFISLFFVLTLTTTSFQSLTSHRYYLPLFISGTFIMLLLWQEISWTFFQKKIVLLALSISLITGHFWRYPDIMAQGWDASLAYKPVFSIWDETREYVRRRNILEENVGSFFPFLGAQKYVTLTTDTSSFSPFDASKMDYLFLSNVTNDAPDSIYHAYPWVEAEFYVEKGSIRAGLFKIKK